MKRMFFAAAAAILFVSAIPTGATPITGTISTYGATTGTGPWVLTAGGGVAIDLTSPLTFGEITDLNAVFVDNVGGVSDGDVMFALFSSAHAPLFVSLGPPPSFTDPSPASFTAAFSGLNLINGTNNTGTIGPVTPFAFWQSIYGSDSISRLTFSVLGPDSRNLTLCSVNINNTMFGSAGEPCGTTEVPESPTLPIMAAGLVGLLGFGFIRRRREDNDQANLFSAA